MLDQRASIDLGGCYNWQEAALYTHSRKGIRPATLAVWTVLIQADCISGWLCYTGSLAKKQLNVEWFMVSSVPFHANLDRILLPSARVWAVANRWNNLPSFRNLSLSLFGSLQSPSTLDMKDACEIPRVAHAESPFYPSSVELEFRCWTWSHVCLRQVQGKNHALD